MSSESRTHKKYLEIWQLNKAFATPQGPLVVVEDFNLTTPKTKDFVSVLATLEVKKTTLIVTDNANQNLERASRNVENVEVTTSDFVNTYQLLRSDKLVFTRGAFQKLEERLQK